MQDPLLDFLRISACTRVVSILFRSALPRNLRVVQRLLLRGDFFGVSLRDLLRYRLRIVILTDIILSVPLFAVDRPGIVHVSKASERLNG